MQRSRTVSTAAQAVGAIALFLALAGCGDDVSGPGNAAADDETSSTASVSATGSPTAPALAACADVWQEGQDLPGNYRGCLDGTTEVRPEIVDCSSGQRIVTYDDHYWAVRGHRIGYAPDGLRNDKHYAQVLYGCRA
jgi:hypothetical protein